MYSNLGFEYMFGSLAPRGGIMVFGMFLVYFRCHMTFGDKPRHDGEAGTTQSVRLWKKASLFSILSITHRSEVQLMQGQRRWKDNSIVYNFDVDTMVKFRIMKEHGVFQMEHGVFLHWNCPRKLQGPNTARNTACSIWSTPCPTPRRVFKSFSFSNLVQKPINTPETPVDEIYFIIHIFFELLERARVHILNIHIFFELLERARVPERRLKREDQPRLAKGKSSSRRLGFPRRTCRLLRFFFSSLVIYFSEPWVAKLSVLFGWDEALAKLCMDDLICYWGLFRLMMRSS